MPLIGSLVRQAANINSSRRLIILRSNSRIAAIGFYEVGIAERPIFITSSADSSSSSVSSTVPRQKSPCRAHFQDEIHTKLLYNNYIINFKALKNF